VLCSLCVITWHVSWLYLNAVMSLVQKLHSCCHQFCMRSVKLARRNVPRLTHCMELLSRKLTVIITCSFRHLFVFQWKRRSWWMKCSTMQWMFYLKRIASCRKWKMFCLSWGEALAFIMEVDGTRLCYCLWSYTKYAWFIITDLRCFLPKKVFSGQVKRNFLKVRTC